MKMFLPFPGVNIEIGDVLISSKFGSILVFRIRGNGEFDGAYLGDWGIFLPGSPNYRTITHYSRADVFSTLDELGSSECS
jgi:hypothetical protein